MGESAKIDLDDRWLSPSNFRFLRHGVGHNSHLLWRNQSPWLFCPDFSRSNTGGDSSSQRTHSLLPWRISVGCTLCGKETRDDDVANDLRFLSQSHQQLFFLRRGIDWDEVSIPGGGNKWAQQTEQNKMCSKVFTCWGSPLAKLGYKCDSCWSPSTKKENSKTEAQHSKKLPVIIWQPKQLSSIHAVSTRRSGQWNASLRQG